MSDKWSPTNMYDAYVPVSFSWSENDPSRNVSADKFHMDDGQTVYPGKYGKDISSTSEAYDDVDFVARTIFSECCNANPRRTNAHAIAQNIKNRMNVGSFGGSTARGVCATGQYQGLGTAPWRKPSADTYDPQFDESYLTQEMLWVECVFLAKALVDGVNMPTGVVDTGNAVYMYHVNTKFISEGSIPFFKLSGQRDRCTKDTLGDARYQGTTPIYGVVSVKGGSYDNSIYYLKNE